MPSLIFLNGPKANQRVYLSGGEVFGRDPAAEIPILAPGVSRRHGQIVKVEGTFNVFDLGSMNHTYVNKKQITRSVLKAGDVISIGGVHMQFADDVEMMEEDEADAEPDVAGSMDATLVFRDGMIQRAGEDQGGLEATVKSLEGRLKTVYDVAQALGSVRSTNELLNTVMHKLFEAFPQADRGLVMVGDTFETLQPRVIHYRSPDGDGRVPVSRTLARTVYKNRQSILCKDVFDLGGQVGSSDTLASFGHRSLVSAPLIFQDECLGFIQLDAKGKGRFTDESLNLLTGIAALAAIFLKNDKLVRLTNLERYFSEDLARQICNNELDLKPGGDMKRGPVFFSDLIGFTSLSEKLTPFEVIRLMNQYFEVMVNIILKHRGYIDKFIGDAIMAVWGAPVELEQEAIYALRAAIEMQNALYLLNCELKLHPDWQDRDLPQLKMGIGLNSGRFVAGNLGSERRMEYTIIGDAVNLAQRVESQACIGQVLVSESTYEACDRSVLACRLRPMQVKGKSQAVTMYSMRGVPSPDSDLYLMSMPFLVALDGVWLEGLLVKAKRLQPGTIVAQILVPQQLVGKRATLRFCPQEAPNFDVAFEIQREVPLKERYGACYNGALVGTGHMIEELIDDGVFISPKSPADMVRNKVFDPDEV